MSDETAGSGDDQTVEITEDGRDCMSCDTRDTTGRTRQGPESFCNCQHLAPAATCWYCSMRDALADIDGGSR